MATGGAAFLGGKVIAQRSVHLASKWNVAEVAQLQQYTLLFMHAEVAPELTDLERTRSGVQNLNVAVREWNDQIIFLRKILPGRADQSYGIQVARLVGLPDSIITRAKQILENLEKSELNAAGQPTTRRRGLNKSDDTEVVPPKWRALLRQRRGFPRAGAA